MSRDSFKQQQRGRGENAICLNKKVESVGTDKKRLWILTVARCGGAQKAEAGGFL